MLPSRKGPHPPARKFADKPTPGKSTIDRKQCDMKAHSYAKRGGTVAFSLGLLALGLVVVPGSANAAGTDPCASPTKSVTYSGATATTHGTVRDDTTVGSVFVTDDSSNNSQTAEWPAVDASYHYCTVTGTGYRTADGVSTGQWTIENDGSDFAQSYRGGSDEFLNDITVTYVVGPAPRPATRSLPAYRSGQRFVFRSSISPSATGATSSLFGAASDIGILGDWNGDGHQSPAVFRPSNHTFSFASDADGRTLTATAVFGAAGDQPIAGDFDGNGTDSIGVYRPSTSTFYVTNNNKIVVKRLPYGSNGDKPIVGDWDGKGITGLGVYRPASSTFYRPGRQPIKFGLSGDQPVIGDWNGDHTSNIGVVRGNIWYTAKLGDRTSNPAFTFGPKGASWLALTARAS